MSWIQLMRCSFHPQIGKIPRSKKWQPAPIFLPGKSHGQSSMTDCSPRDHKELGMTGHTHILLHYQNTMNPLHQEKINSQVEFFFLPWKLNTRMIIINFKKQFFYYILVISIVSMKYYNNLPLLYKAFEYFFRSQKNPSHTFF